jgi:hypothetical protein
MPRRPLLVTALTVLGAGCIAAGVIWRQAIRIPDLPVPVPKGSTLNRPTCPDASTDEYFFPEGTLDQGRRTWYSAYLRVMREPSLSCGNAHDEAVYRFFYLPSFHDPIAVRLTRTHGSCSLVVAELNKTRRNEHFGLDPGSLRQRADRVVLRLDCDQMIRDIDAKDLWTLSTIGPEAGNDGAQWVVEARRANGYHVVDRWGGDELRSIGLSFLGQAKLSIPPAELY